MKNLTERQADVLRAIIAYKQQYDGTSPSFEDLGDALGITKPTIAVHVRALVRKGYLAHVQNNARGFIVSGGSWSPPEGLQPFAEGDRPTMPPVGNRHKRRSTRSHKCECGKQASVTVCTEVGDIHLCRDCARLELELF